MAKKSTSPRSKPKATVSKKTADAKVSSVERSNPPLAKLPSSWKNTKKACSILWRHRRLFIIITLIYGLLNLVLVQGLASGTDVTSLKEQLDKVFTGHFGSITSSLSIFVVLVSSSGNSSSQTAGAYQLFIALITSLAIIWALRQVRLGNRLRVRDAYYRGMYPLIPFLLVLLVIGLQLIPLIVGSTLYSTVISSGIAIHATEKVLWAVIFLALGSISIYMLSSSLFALYIVTLPDMTPMKALRSARKLVQKRRWPIIRKLLFLPIVLLIVSGLIMVPIIILAAAFSQWVFFVLTMFALIAIHAYIYTLYRELIGE